MDEYGMLRNLRDEEENKAWEDYVQYAFAPDMTESDFSEILTKLDMEERKGYFVENEMVSICALLCFEGRLRGNLINIAGLSDVATPPEYRRKGYARIMLRQFLQQIRQRGYYICALWPFDVPFYRMMGWDVVCERLLFELNVEHMHRLVRNFSIDGRFICGGYEHVDKLDAIYETWSSEYDLTLKRNTEWWENRILKHHKKDPYVYIYEDSSGQPAGYVIFRFGKYDDDGRILRVVDYGYSHLDAYRALLKFLFLHDSQVKKFKLAVPVMDPLFEWYTDGKMSLHRAAMLRIVDVKESLSALRYPSDMSGNVVLELQDEFMDCNDGAFAISFSDGRAEISETAADANADVMMDIQGLSQMYVGYRSLDDLVRLERADVKCREKANPLKQAFCKRRTHMPDVF